MREREISFFCASLGSHIEIPQNTLANPPLGPLISDHKYRNAMWVTLLCGNCANSDCVQEHLSWQEILPTFLKTDSVCQKFSSVFIRFLKSNTFTHVN